VPSFESAIGELALNMGDKDKGRHASHAAMIPIGKSHGQKGISDSTQSSGFVVLVSFRLKSGMLKKFIGLVLANARASLKHEPECLQFDVMVPDGTENEVFLYEVYANREAFAFHSKTSHYAVFSKNCANSIISKTVIAGPRMDIPLSEPRE